MTDFTANGQTREHRWTKTAHENLDVGTIMFSAGRFLGFTASPVGLAVDLLRITDAGLTLGRVISGGHEIALEDPNNITLLLPQKGRIELLVDKHDHVVPSGSLKLVLAERRRTRVLAPVGGAFLGTTVQIPRRRLLAQLAADPGAGGSLPDRPVLAINTAFARLAGQLLSQLADDVFRQPDRMLLPRAQAEFVSLIDDLLHDVTGRTGSDPRAYGGFREFQRVSRACDIMQARADEAMSMAELASELGITSRSLQLAFRAAHGMSPRQYLERLRLDRVRQRFLSRGEAGSVTAAALDCGFIHLGRFSQVYRRTFGELPNQTRARHRP